MTELLRQIDDTCVVIVGKVKRSPSVPNERHCGEASDLISEMPRPIGVNSTYSRLRLSWASSVS